MYRLVLATIVILALVIAFVAISGPAAKKGASLYERLGGIYDISSVIDDFSDALIKNPMVGRDSPNAYLREWSRDKPERLPGLKYLRTTWVAALAGGPYKFAATKPGKCPFSLENAHAKFQISSEEFDEVARELEKSLTKFKVGGKEKAEVLAVFKAHKPEVVRGYDVAHGLPVTPVRC